jgi:hypothetical protein
MFIYSFFANSTKLFSMYNSTNRKKGLYYGLFFCLLFCFFLSNKVNAQVSIDTQPTVQTVCVGATATYSVVATGTVSGYQWYKNGVLLTGETATSYSIASTTAANNGDKYKVDVFCSCGGDVMSSEVGLTVNLNPTISVQPVGATKCVGENYSFSVTAANAGSYQWRKNGTNLVNGGSVSGATTASLTITGLASPADEANYDVVVLGSGACASQSTTSTAVSLVVNSPANISSGSSATIATCEGDVMTLELTTNAGNITGYQWQKGGTNIAGQTSSTYNKTNLAPSDAGTYTLVAFATCGNDTENYTVTVASKPTISVQPVGATKCVGENYSFSVTAANAGGYEWYKDGVIVANGSAGGGSSVSGSTTGSMTISNLCATCNVGSYTVKVLGAGACGSQSVTSAAAVLAINSPVVIVSQPVPQTVCEGTAVTFSVGTGGTITGFQWYKNGMAIVGANSNSYGLTTTPANNGDKYRIELTGPCGNVTSTEVTLVVNTKPLITAQPVGATKCAGESVTLNVGTTNAGSFQWYINNSAIAGQTTAALNLTNLTQANAGTYKVIVNGAGACSSVSLTSSDATLIINQPIVITTQPVTQTLCENSNVTLSVVATGTNPSYQWYKDGVVIAGATNASYTINNTSPSNTGRYKVEVKGTCTPAGVVSSEVVLQIDTKPTLTTQPVGATKCAGESITLNVGTTNAGSFQWYINNSAITGQTTAALNLTNLTQANAGTYKVIANGYGACSSVALTSSDAALIINQPIVITTQPIAQTICENNAVTFSVSATGTNPSYQWYKDGVAIAGATNVNYSINNTVPTNAGKYKVEIKGTCTPSGIISTEVELKITHIDPPTITTNKPDGMCAGQESILTANGCGGIVHWYSDGSEVATGAAFTTKSTATFTAKCEQFGCFSVTASNAIKPVQLSVVSYVATKQNITCFAGQTGSIDIAALGAAGAPFTINWAHLSGSATNKVVNLRAGSYSFTITDRIGCKIESTEALLEPNKPTGSFKSTDITCFGAANGKIALTASSDYGGFKYSLNGAATVPFESANNHVVTNLKKGTFSIGIVDAKECVVLPSIQTTINEPALLVLAVQSSKNPRGAITKDGNIEVSIAGGIAPYSVSWFDKNNKEITSNIQNNANTSKIGSIDGGTYKAVIKDKNGCEQTISNTLITPEAITITAKLDSITCFGKTDGQIAVVIAGGITTSTQLPYKTIWNKVNADGTKNKINSDVLAVANLLPGTYEITATDANDISRTTQFTLTNPTELKTNVGRIVANHCTSTPLGEVYFDVVGGRKPYKITWNNNTITGTALLKLPAGNQAISVSDASGCLNNVTAIVPDETQSFKVNVVYEQPTCFGRCDAKLTSAVAGGFTPYQYDWSNVNVTQANPNNVCGKGETILTIKDNKGCILKSSTITLTTPAARALGLAKDKEVCPTKPFELNASSLTWAKTFTWTLPNGKTKTGSIIQGDTVGVYKIVALDENSCGGEQEIAAVPNKNVTVLFTIASIVPMDKNVVAVDFSSPNPTEIKWEVPASVTLVSQDPNRTKFKFSQKGFFKIKELATIDNCVYPLIKQVEVVDKVEDKGFPVPFSSNKFDFNILGNPINNGRVSIEVTNEDNEPFTVLLNAMTGGQTIVEKNFSGQSDQIITIELPTQRSDIEYVITVVRGSTKISKKIIVIR